MLRGAEDLREVCQHRINHDPFETNPEGTLSWEEVECLGACVNAPMVMVGSDTYEDLTVDTFNAMIDGFVSGKPVKPGPQIARQFSAAEGGATTLTEAPTAKRTYKPFPPPPPPAPAPGAAPAAAAPAAPASPPPTTAAKPRDVSEESAPALKEPKASAKVSVAKAESERQETNTAARANGEPNKAMREDATGAESPAGKKDAGKAPGKPRGKKGTE
jgi:NADH-quinone oxidoreductase subunit E